MDERTRDEAARRAGRAVGAGCSLAVAALLAVMFAIVLAAAWQILRAVVGA